MPNSKHGHAAGKPSKTYNSWHGMWRRIRGKSPWYKNITVCDEWKSFERFLADMGQRPDGMTLDRIDSAGNYEPSNCRWATPTQQTKNRRKGVRLTAVEASQIRWLRSDGGFSGVEVAQAFGVSQVTVSAVVTGKTWVSTDG